MLLILVPPLKLCWRCAAQQVLLYQLLLRCSEAVMCGVVAADPQAHQCHHQPAHCSRREPAATSTHCHCWPRVLWPQRPEHTGGAADGCTKLGNIVIGKLPVYHVPRPAKSSASLCIMLFVFMHSYGVPLSSQHRLSGPCVLVCCCGLDHEECLLFCCVRLLLRPWTLTTSAAPTGRARDSGEDGHLFVGSNDQMFCWQS